MASSPPPTPRRYDWPGITARLKAKPGEWMCVLTGEPKTVYGAIKRKRMRALQEPGWDFEVTTRNNNEEAKTCDYWMVAQRVRD
jgi:hypothetical protein